MTKPAKLTVIAHFVHQKSTVYMLLTLYIELQVKVFDSCDGAYL